MAHANQRPGPAKSRYAGLDKTKTKTMTIVIMAGLIAIVGLVALVVTSARGGTSQGTGVPPPARSPDCGGSLEGELETIAHGVTIRVPPSWQVAGRSEERVAFTGDSGGSARVGALPEAPPLDQVFTSLIDEFALFSRTMEFDFGNPTPLPTIGSLTEAATVAYSSVSKEPEPRDPSLEAWGGLPDTSDWPGTFESGLLVAATREDGRTLTIDISLGDIEGFPLSEEERTRAFEAMHNFAAVVVASFGCPSG